MRGIIISQKPSVSSDPRSGHVHITGNRRIHEDPVAIAAFGRFPSGPKIFPTKQKNE